eukprot:scaffold15933_cov36-Phaeocystis_antarctica.AAC.2
MKRPHKPGLRLCVGVKLRAASGPCSILHGKDHKAPRAAPLVFSSCTLRDFARTHRAHAEASYGGLVA